MAAVDPVTAVSNAVTQTVALIAQKDAQYNTPGMVAAAQSDQVQRAKESIVNAVLTAVNHAKEGKLTDEDLEKIRLLGA